MLAALHAVAVALVHVACSSVLIHLVNLCVHAHRVHVSIGCAITCTWHACAPVSCAVDTLDLLCIGIMWLHMYILSKIPCRPITTTILTCIYNDRAPIQCIGAATVGVEEVEELREDLGKGDMYHATLNSRHARCTNHSADHMTRHST